MAILFIRCLLLYALVLAAMKLMGKRQLGQLQPFELVAILIISEMASLSIQSNSVPLLYSVIPIVTITLLQIMVSLANLKSQRLRDLICGRPDALIAGGKLQEQTLRRLRLNLNDVEGCAGRKAISTSRRWNGPSWRPTASFRYCPRRIKGPWRLAT